jgi:hypothetical protein
MGGGERNNTISTHLVNHLQQAHLSDGQYKAYITTEKDRVAAKSGKQQPSNIAQASIIIFTGDNKEVTKSGKGNRQKGGEPPHVLYSQSEKHISC